MQEKLFDIRQVLLFVGRVPAYDGIDAQVEQMVLDLGFSSEVQISGQRCMITKNLYSGWFEDFGGDDLLYLIKERIYEKCRERHIGMFDFFLIDSTDTAMFKSIWHDGFY